MVQNIKKMKKDGLKHKDSKNYLVSFPFRHGFVPGFSVNMPEIAVNAACTGFLGFGRSVATAFMYFDRSIE